MKFVRFMMISLILTLFVMCQGPKEQMEDRSAIGVEKNEAAHTEKGQVDDLIKTLKEQGFAELKSLNGFFSIDSLAKYKAKRATPEFLKIIGLKSDNSLYNVSFYNTDNFIFLILKAYEGDFIIKFQLLAFNKLSRKINSEPFLLASVDDTKYQKIFSAVKLPTITRFNVIVKKTELDENRYVKAYNVNFDIEKFEITSDALVTLISKKGPSDDRLEINDFDSKLMYDVLRSKE